MRIRALLAALAVVAIVPMSASAQEGMRPLGAVDADRIRIRAHLERVEHELRAADVSHLSPAQRAARASNVERLRVYRARAEFPHGHSGQPGARVPTFIDADGRACAMGQLVIESGHADVARDIARHQNHARVPAIDHPALAGWLEANGMTLAEATRVQPSYCFECGDGGAGDPVCGSDGRVYTSTCLAECEGITVVGAATCDGETCSCSDAGAMPTDAGENRDAGALPRLDGGGGAVTPSGGCSVGNGGASAGWALAFGAALALIAIRRRGAC